MRFILFALAISAGFGCYRGNSQTTAPRTNTQEAALDPSQQNPNNRTMPGSSDVGTPNDPGAPNPVPSTDPTPPPPNPVPPTVPPPPDPNDPDPLDKDTHPMPPTGPDTP